ncbi:glycoside hydrolase family 3 C-terminal domain-containing protein [Paracidobacterium acidisoli]|uniref:glycoside hydrolase family 3 C-terminal domain-containing protein n=1 Tax=Paracidobacterium acidisoli TaxID=2303751 RepID=UPI00207A6848|nr:glycoside hydrolase family 3 C-terminal domain-containing protein [Paracidobacterium acidisoli]
MTASLLFGGAAASAQKSESVWRDPSQPIEKRVDALVSQMTLEEKAAQMNNDAPGIPRLGVPEYDYWSEGLHGIARSGYSTLFPQAIGLAATWDAPLLHDDAGIIALEARAKYNQAIRDDIHSIFFGLTIWSPNINIFRDPRWGRGQETYGEDPFLTSRMGIAFATGLQGNDPKYFLTIATPKHFAVHSGPESDRHRFNVNVSPHDLEDTYTPAFRALITEGHTDSIMCAYNAIDGVPACASDMLLKDHLRDAWKFQGFVTSDCGAVTDFFSKTGHHYSPDVAHASAAAVKAGTDTACGTEFSGLPQAVREGLITEPEVDVSLKRLFVARMRLGLFDPPSMVHYAQIPFTENNTPMHRELSLKTAEESIVLLKNDGVLPLKPSIHRVAVIGPNAASLAAIEGNYNAIPSNPVLPVDGIEEALRGKATVTYQQGSSYVQGMVVPVPRTVLRPAESSKQEGLKGEYFSNPQFSGSPALTRVDKQVDFDWNAASPLQGSNHTDFLYKDFSVRWTGFISAPAPGKYHFSVRQGQCHACKEHDSYSIWLDGKQVYTNSTQNTNNWHEHPATDFVLDLTSTGPHALRIEYAHHDGLFGAGITFEWQPPAGVLRAEAVKAAQSSDLVLAFVGLSPNLEGEEMKVDLDGFIGGDRTNIDLPQEQKDLLEALAQTGKPVVVVLMSGSAVAMTWSKEHAAALIEAWYPGEAGGEAIADVLTGRYNPAGRLPITFYASDSQLPPFTDYSMKNRTYRYFTGEPLYGFGYGLSYTKFAYSGLKLSTTSLEAGKALTAEVTVTNKGGSAGDEVAELYLIPPQSSPMPLRSLEGFRRVHLAPGASTTVKFDLSPRQLSEVDSDGKRAVRAGSYQVYAGGSQPEEGEGVSQKLTITGESSLPE